MHNTLTDYSQLHYQSQQGWVLCTWRSPPADQPGSLHGPHLTRNLASHHSAPVYIMDGRWQEIGKFNLLFRFTQVAGDGGTAAWPGHIAMTTGQTVGTKDGHGRGGPWSSSVESP